MPRAVQKTTQEPRRMEIKPFINEQTFRLTTLTFHTSKGEETEVNPGVQDYVFLDKCESKSYIAFNNIDFCAIFYDKNGLFPVNKSKSFRN